MKLFLPALLCTCILGALALPATAAEKERRLVGDARIYGEYPLGYQIIITNFLRDRLVDPATANITWEGEPRPVKVARRGQRPLVGYSVNFKVNSRNRFGMYTGNQPYRVIIRNGEVIHVDRGGAPKKKR